MLKHGYRCQRNFDRSRGSATSTTLWLDSCELSKPQGRARAPSGNAGTNTNTAWSVWHQLHTPHTNRSATAQREAAARAELLRHGAERAGQLPLGSSLEMLLQLLLERREARQKLHQLVTRPESKARKIESGTSGLGLLFVVVVAVVAPGAACSLLLSALTAVRPTFCC